MRSEAEESATTVNLPGILDLKERAEKLEQHARELQRHLALGDYDGSEDARARMDEARKHLRWAAGDLEAAHEQYGGWVIESPEQSKRQSEEVLTEMLDFAVSHGVTVRLDGSQYCALFPDFVNLQESPAGFGGSPFEAVTALRDDVDGVGR